MLLKPRAEEGKAAFIRIPSDRLITEGYKSGVWDIQKKVRVRGEFPSPLLSSCSDYSCPCTSGKGRDVLDLRRSDWLVGAATFRSLESYDETKYSLFRLKRSLPEALGQWPTFSDSASWSAEPLCGLSAGKPRLTEGFRSRSLPAATPFRCLF